MSAAAGTSALVNALEKAEADMMHEEALRVFGKDLNSANAVPLVLIHTLAFLEAKPDQLVSQGSIPTNSLAPPTRYPASLSNHQPMTLSNPKPAKTHLKPTSNPP